MRTTEEKTKGLFINPAKANCSIYESGLMVYKSLLLSKKYYLDYVEVDEDHHTISTQYDFYAFNYHYWTMGWLRTKSIRSLPGLKITFVLEMAPNNPFVLSPERDFDAYCVLDPTMNVSDKRVYAFPRPLEVSRKTIPYHEPEVPIIGTFGFAAPGKGFELVVDAVNKEFSDAIVRINMPQGTYTEKTFWKLHNKNYGEYLTEACHKAAKAGVKVVVTREYMTKDELINWCGQNTLNCFLYDRNLPGLSATTDQAIASGRPLAVSNNDTFRHIHQYIKPYPLRSLKESISSSQPQVMKMQQDWAPDKFAARFERLLENFGICPKKTGHGKEPGMIQLQKKQFPETFISRCKGYLDYLKKKLKS